jgi:hypothetical protein
MFQRFFAEGGFAMFFLMAFGIATLGAATVYAWRVTRVSLKLTFGLALATGFATLAGIFVDLATVGHQASDYVSRHPGVTLADAVLQGIGESLAPGILGCTFLSVAALVLTVGFYREPNT